MIGRKRAFDAVAEYELCNDVTMKLEEVGKAGGLMQDEFLYSILARVRIRLGLSVPLFSHFYLPASVNEICAYTNFSPDIRTVIKEEIANQQKAHATTELLKLQHREDNLRLYLQYFLPMAREYRLIMRINAFSYTVETWRLTTFGKLALPARAVSSQHADTPVLVTIFRRCHPNSDNYRGAIGWGKRCGHARCRFTLFSFRPLVQVDSKPSLFQPRLIAEEHVLYGLDQQFTPAKENVDIYEVYLSHNCMGSLHALMSLRVKTDLFRVWACTPVDAAQPDKKPVPKDVQELVVYYLHDIGKSIVREYDSKWK